ncbi:MAG: WD40 repeat domain-containing protein [Methanosarcinales archaeon]|nr:MAG: WD40 repeat domain-containing protein [Methanosarcinales archaeon]
MVASATTSSAAAALARWLRTPRSHTPFLWGVHVCVCLCARVCIAWCAGAVVSASWDATVKVWDLRSPSMAAPEDASTRAADMTLALPERAFSMSLCSDYIVLVATAGQHLVAYDLRKGDEMLWKRESTVKFQLRCIRAFADGKGYVVSSIDGRCGVEYMEEADGKPFSFKCHRSKTPDGKELITPVNALAFNPVYNTFVTGGGDGTVAAWDHVSKKRLAVLGTYPTSIAALAFNRCVQAGYASPARPSARANAVVFTLPPRVRTHVLARACACVCVCVADAGRAPSWRLPRRTRGRRVRRSIPRTASMCTVWGAPWLARALRKVADPAAMVVRHASWRRCRPSWRARPRVRVVPLSLILRTSL